jgi:sugar phosphate isomerase/epimerase/pimeloyl-ACP methyl ester carboxylesterase
MRLGVLAKIFVRPTLAETLDAVVSHRLDCIQFNFASAGLPGLPDKIAPDLAAQIGRELAQRRLMMAGVSGTFNMIDPDLSRRQAGLRRLEELAASCATLGTSVITLCTGTRDPQDMWRHHPQNESAEAWRDMIQSIAAALEIAVRYNVFLGVEPETANVISSAKKARRLLDELQSPRLKIIMDAANLFYPGDPAKKEDVLTEAFDLLGKDIVLAHAKDFRDQGGMEYVAPGKGMLPWPHYLRLLHGIGYAGPLIMHSLAESEVEESAAFLRKNMTGCEASAPLAISAIFRHDDINFHYQEAGGGVPFFFQHGLCGDVSQPFALFQPPAGFRLLSFDCRAHGQTRPVGPDEKISMSSFADDLLALMDHLGIARAVVGGISMGAAVALNFVLRHPDRVLGLIMQRPAWLDERRRENVEIYSTMAQLIRRHGAQKGLEVFQLSQLYQDVLKQSPSTAKSLVGQFLHPRAEETVVLLERIPLDTPNHDRADWRAIKAPTLVLANRLDPVHPFEYGVTLAREIPGAAFQELTPKSVSVERHTRETQRFIEGFLLQHFSSLKKPDPFERRSVNGASGR